MREGLKCVKVAGGCVAVACGGDMRGSRKKSRSSGAEVCVGAPTLSLHAIGARLRRQLEALDEIFVLDGELSSHGGVRDLSLLCGENVAFLILMRPSSDSSCRKGLPGEGRRCIFFGAAVVISGVDMESESRTVRLHCRLLPMCLRVAPLAATLPPKYDTLVLGGAFVSLNTYRYGSSDLGPLSEGSIPLDACAMLPSFPAVRLEAVSGRYPYFHRQGSKSTAATMAPGAYSANDSVVLDDAVERDSGSPLLTARAALDGEGARHASLCSAAQQRFISFVSSVFQAGDGGGASATTRTDGGRWYIVSYPDGPPLLATADTTTSTAAPLKKRAGEPRGATDCTPSSSTVKEPHRIPVPAWLVLPSQFLCGSVTGMIGWRSISPSYHAAVEGTLHAVAQLMERETIPLHWNSSDSAVCCVTSFSLASITQPAISFSRASEL